MALFGRDRERGDRPRGSGQEPLVPPPPPVPQAPPREVQMFEREREKAQPDETSGTSAFLGKGSRVTGKLTFEGTVRIEGHVEGEISAQDTLIVGETAVVNAQINGASVVVHGRVTGDITARKRLEIRAPGKVFGNITTPSLVIHEGVVFEGQCAMGGAEAARAEKDRKVAFLPKDERPGDGAAHKAHSELAK
jgi:cytoskeletal protein CcmA (bactofilin family)